MRSAPYCSYSVPALLCSGADVFFLLVGPSSLRFERLPANPPPRGAATAAPAAAAARYRVSDPHPVLGSRLAVRLPAGVRAGEVVAVAVRYSAPPGATAVQWLPPEQTAGKRHPYLFTQCQAIHARSILPCQDAPAAKFTYTAAVRVPRQLRALMSAVPVEGEGRDDGDGGTADLRHVAPRPGTKVYRFR